jgi:NAD(P)-dependent dehydrogenase (short-subunit alcohol dehydrogenase family)
LALVQALGDVGWEAPLWCLTNGAVSTGPDDPAVRPSHVAIWGLGFVARLEYPHRWGGLVDLPSTVDETTAARLRAVLTGHDGEDQVAIRAGGVLVRRVCHAPEREDTGRTWRPRGTALVLGGTGALGGHVARWLASQGCDHVVLVSRRGIRAPGAAELESALTALGTKVTVAGCDITDRDALSMLVDELRNAGDEVRAVFHCAGAAQSTGLGEMSQAEFAAVTAAKVVGAGHLEDLFPSDLDAFVLFSCFPGVWGSYGRGASAAADAFLDGLARRRRASGRRATSIAWGAWRAGATLEDPLVIEQLRRGGVSALDPDLALGVLAAALSDDTTSQLVIDLDWPTFAAVFTARRPSRLIEDLPELRAPAPRVTALPAADRRHALSDLVRVHVAAVLAYSRPDEVDMGSSFAELGFDPASLRQLHERLGDATGLPVPDCPTPAKLAAELAETLED